METFKWRIVVEIEGTKPPVENVQKVKSKVEDAVGAAVDESAQFINVWTEKVNNE